MTEQIGQNWAGNHTYGAASLLRPKTAAEVQDIIARGTRVRALGSRHSFSDLADTSGDLVSLEDFDPALEIDEDARTASFAPGLRYGDLGTLLQAKGWAIHNLASLPHISIAGAVATGTHGSGDRNGNLATAVAALEFVDGTGELVSLRRGDAEFDAAVVSLGALGIVTRMTLDIQPTFSVRQDTYAGLQWDALLANFDAITSSAYSVSVFTSWIGDAVGSVWLKSRMDQPAPPAALYGATILAEDRHMITEMEPTNTTPQGGLPGPWNDRLAHFKLEFTPSNGDELQSEFLVPRARALEAVEAVRELGESIAPILHITELRTMSADSLWLSGAYETDALGIHFTWKKLPDQVAPVLAQIEDRLLPLGARPHWGKVFRAGVDKIAPLYPRFEEFLEVARRRDPKGLFRNAYLERTLGL
ncbi:MAG: FAD-binding protein [Glaciihabitans sp.]|jgi:xylitol oxidase|nr:FAD-binding protein [Glaciihabitans sp.]MCU1534163.1 FAD-binding protein [Glaciihabitans sp.]MDQ1555961.1 alditol oxidase [Actinomycetota bacterium]